MPLSPYAGEAFMGRSGGGFGGNGRTATGLATGGLSELFGSHGPTAEERLRQQQLEQMQLRGSISRAQDEARVAGMRGASGAIGGGNPFLAGRLGARAGAEGAARVQAAGVTAMQQQQMAQAQANALARQQQGQQAQQTIGGLLGAGGQVLGMAIPAFGALRGAAGATGLSGAIGNSMGGQGGFGGMLGSALGAPQQPPQAPTPQVGFGGAIGTTAPPGMRWDPMRNQWVPADPIPGGIGGASYVPAFGSR